MQRHHGQVGKVTTARGSYLVKDAEGRCYKSIRIELKRACISAGRACVGRERWGRYGGHDQDSWEGTGCGSGGFGSGWLLSESQSRVYL
jgi:hypothetical protein